MSTHSIVHTHPPTLLMMLSAPCDTLTPSVHVAWTAATRHSISAQPPSQVRGVSTLEIECSEMQPVTHERQDKSNRGVSGTHTTNCRPGSNQLETTGQCLPNPVGSRQELQGYSKPPAGGSTHISNLPPYQPLQRLAGVWLVGWLAGHTNEQTLYNRPPNHTDVDSGQFNQESKAIAVVFCARCVEATAPSIIPQPPPVVITHHSGIYTMYVHTPNKRPPPP